MEKVDFKSKYKEIYNNKNASVVELKEFNYISIEGEGSPTSDLFNNSIGALYAVAYTISMSYKSDNAIDGFYPFVMPPLEGEWTTIDQKEYTGDKNNLKWTIMIMMPSFVTINVFKDAKNSAFIKKEYKLIKKVRLINQKAKTVGLIQHVGSFDNEVESFEILEKYLKENNYQRSSKNHKEIYLSDLRKTVEEKLRTVLVVDIEKITEVE